MAGRITLGLYNSYDPNHFHEAMRRAIARAAPLAYAFDLNVALFGFPFKAYRTKSGERPDPRTPQDLAALVADSTSIGEGGGFLTRLAGEGRFQAFDYPDRGWPPQLGTAVLATQEPDPAKRLDLDALANRALAGESFVVLVGLGPRGVPKRIETLVPHHLELTGRGVGLETATALGVLAGRLASSVEKGHQLRSPHLSVDAVAIRDDTILLVRRGRPPAEGMWSLPGGFVEAGETCASAVLRELREETGLVGRDARLLGVYDDPKRDPRFHTVTLAYAVRVEGEPKGGDDAAEARFHPLKNLPPLAFDHGRIVTEARSHLSL